MTLQIECPQCQQTFEVGEELKGRTVECGSCEKRFKVSPEVMVQNRERIFPDELKKKADLSGFARAPKQNAPVDFPTTRYESPAKSAIVGRAPLSRTVAAAVGLLILLFTLALLYFGTRSPTGALADFGQNQRLILGGFFSLIGFVLVAWGMVKARFLGFLLGALGAAGIVSLALFMPTRQSLIAAQSELTAVDDYIPLDEREIQVEEVAEGKDMTREQVLSATRWKATVQPAIVSGREGEVVGIWVRGMEEYLSLEIQNYLRDTFDLPLQPDFRTLNDGGIFLMTGVPFDMEEVVGRVSRFGEVEQVLPEMCLIQMSVNNAVLGQGATVNSAKLNDPTSDAFYSLNYNELLALAPARMEAAVKRLRLAEPVQLRKDITVRLVALLNEEQNASLYEDLAEALLVWSEPGDGADQVMVGITERMHAADKTIPEGIITFLVQRQTPDAAPLLTTLWAKSPSTRQSTLIKYGSNAAELVAPYLASESQAVSRSAALILAEIAGADELPKMRETLQTAVDPQFRSLLERSIAEVESRQ